MFEVTDVRGVVREFAEVVGRDEVMCFEEGIAEFIGRDANVLDEQSDGHLSEVSDETPMTVGRDIPRLLRTP